MCTYYKALHKITSHCVVSNANPSSHKPKPVRISAEDRTSLKIIHAWAYVLFPLLNFSHQSRQSRHQIYLPKRIFVTHCEQQTEITNFSCICTNGTSPPDIAKYINTVPNNICSANFAQCRIDTPGSQTCTTCGTLNPTNIPRSTVSSTIASTQSTTASPSGTATSSASAKGGAGRKTFEGGALVGFLTALGIFL